MTERGWEFASLTLGFDWRGSDSFGVGPFLTGTVAEYNVESGKQSFNGASVPLPPTSPASHELFFGGVRGTVNP